MKFIFLTLLLACFLSSCVLTELTTQIGKNSPEEVTLLSHTAEGEPKKAKHFLDWSSRRREIWAYPVIVLLVPLAAVADIIADIGDFPFWVYDWVTDK